MGEVWPGLPSWTAGGGETPAPKIIGQRSRRRCRHLQLQRGRKQRIATCKDHRRPCLWELCATCSSAATTTTIRCVEDMAPTYAAHYTHTDLNLHVSHTPASTECVRSWILVCMHATDGANSLVRCFKHTFGDLPFMDGSSATRRECFTGPPLPSATVRLSARTSEMP